MNYEEISTDRLIELIVTEVGIPLPLYNYSLRLYVYRFPENIKLPGSECVTGIENCGLCATYRGACIEILKWNDGLKNDKQITKN